MIDFTKTYTTKHGWEVKLVVKDTSRRNFQILGFVKDPNGSWLWQDWDEEGRTSAYSYGGNKDFNLIEVRPGGKLERWVNINKGYTKVYTSGGYYKTKEEADRSANPSNSPLPRVACVKVEVEFKEGDGLEEQSKDFDDEEE